MRTRDVVRRGAALGLAVGAIQVLLPMAASADPYGDPGVNGGDLPDNNNHTWCLLNGSPRGPAINNAVANGPNKLDSQTNMTSQNLGWLCPDPHVDIRYILTYDVPYDARGYTGCVRWSDQSRRICDSSDSLLNLDIAGDMHQLAKTSCHELGHTVGISHGGSTDCMLNGTAPAGSQYERYNQHHVDHINNKK
jgi:hypothetical protein